MKHLDESQIALASRGDLSGFANLRARLHLTFCKTCRDRVAEYRQDQQRVKSAVAAFELPRSMKWDELEAEMFGNIRLGLEVEEIHRDAGQVSPVVVQHEAMSWRGLAAAGAMTAIVITGWFLTGPGAQSYLRHGPSAIAQVRSGAVVLRGDEHGVGLENRGTGLMLRNVSAPAGRFEVSLDGSVRASAVDQDSGQVTVSQVYVE
ncbi:MAG: hypothetical protein FJW36_09825 [Acidobacteria bacterium]|nr:hypothetical protein [Acidobacteriota bacterium]